MLSEKEQEVQVGMGRTITTENDVVRISATAVRKLSATSNIPGADPGAVRRVLEDLPGEPDLPPEEEEEPEGGAGGEEPEKEDPERQREEEEESRLETVARVTSPSAEEVLARAALSQRVDNYWDKLLKYVPAESVALYLTLQGIVLSSVEGRALTTWLWIAFGIGIIGTPLYLWRIQQVSKRMQLAVSTAAFGVWVFALGGAFASLSWYEPFVGSVMLVVFTFFVPLISPDVLRS